MPNKFYLDNYHSASASGQAISSLSVSFEVIANACLAQAERLVAEWLPNGPRVGDRWIAADPVQPGYVIRVNLKTGAWTSRPRRVMS